MGKVPSKPYLYRHPPTVQLWTDGSCSPSNPGPGGWGFVLVIGNSCLVEEFGPGGWTTNNKMELLALYRGLVVIEELRLHEHYQIEVVTDSMFVLNCASKWISDWKANGWKKSNGAPIKNLELMQGVDSLLIGKNIIWRWV